MDTLGCATARIQPPRVASWNQMPIFQPPNEEIKRTIANMYADFVENVVIDGSVINYLFRERIINKHRLDKIMSKQSSQNRCRKLLDKLLRSHNEQAFVALRDALKQDYHWIVVVIDCEIVARSRHTAMMMEHAQTIEKHAQTIEALHAQIRQLETKVMFYKDCLLENWKQTENALMSENAWLKEKLRRKEAKLEKATEYTTELRLRLQESQYALEESQKRIKQIENVQQKCYQDDGRGTELCHINSIQVADDISDAVHEILLDDAKTVKNGIDVEKSQPLTDTVLLAAPETSVNGVAYLDERIYFVVRGGLGTICAFEGNAPYNRLADITIKGMSDPRDLVACFDKRCLYVSDCGSCIWRVSHLQNSKAVKYEQWLTGVGWPARLSVTEGRLMVVTNGGLDVFGPNGASGLYQQPMWHIPLPVGMQLPQHAIETRSSTAAKNTPRAATGASGDWTSSQTLIGPTTTSSSSSSSYAIEEKTFLVCHSGGGADLPQHFVSEVTSDRRMMCTFGNGENEQDNLNDPLCVTWCGNDCILVADGNCCRDQDHVTMDETDAVADEETTTTTNRIGRIMVFDHQLRLKEVLPLTLTTTTTEQIANRPNESALATSKGRKLGCPTRLCCLYEKRQLLIGTETGQIIVKQLPEVRRLSL